MEVTPAKPTNLSDSGDVTKFPDMFVETKPEIFRQNVIFSEAELNKPTNITSTGLSVVCYYLL